MSEQARERAISLGSLAVFVSVAALMILQGPAWFTQVLIAVPLLPWSVVDILGPRHAS